MKNLILLILVLCHLTVTGCNNDEVIELSGESFANAEDATYSKENDSDNAGIDADINVQSIENIVDKGAGNNDDSRPFVVYVCGEVKNPGVYRLSDGSRIIDAIIEAGGLSDAACAEYINLAGYVTDTQMIYVPNVSEVDDAGNVQGAAASTEAGIFGSGVSGSGGVYGSIAGVGSSGNSVGSQGNELVDINSATKEQLMTLPGIGEAKAMSIISYREENGKFKSTEDVMKISGIKDGLYSKIKDKICAR